MSFGDDGALVLEDSLVSGVLLDNVLLDVPSTALAVALEVTREDWLAVDEDVSDGPVEDVTDGWAKDLYDEAVDGFEDVADSTGSDLWARAGLLV